MGKFLSVDLGLPSDPIRQVKEIPGGCVRDEIPGASFLSISPIPIRRCKGFGSRGILVKKEAVPTKDTTPPPGQREPRSDKQGNEADDWQEQNTHHGP